MRILAALALALFASLATAQEAFPRYPKAPDLIEFEVSPPSEFRFFVDGSSISVEKDGVVRFVLVARSPAGVDNVSYEALRCPNAEYRIDGVGHPDGSWAGRAGEWRRIPPGQRWHVALYREYFCPQNDPILNADEGVRALRGGGHPFAKGFDGDALRERR